jgi:hypothetical protein
MLWLIFAGLQIYFIVGGIRTEEKAGTWSWSKLAFSLAFAALELCLLMAPYYVVNERSRYFMPLLITSILVAVFNFGWFIVACRRWRLPDGRTSLQAYYDEHPEKKRPNLVP